MRFHVCGAGAVGSLLSYHILRAKHPTDALSIVVRNKDSLSGQMTNPLAPSITVRSQGRLHTRGGFQIEDIDSKTTKTPIWSLFLTTKAYQAHEAVGTLLRRGRLSPNSTLVIMTNGMGVYEELVQKFFEDPASRPHFVLATNTHGVFATSRFNIFHAARGQIHYSVMPDPLGRDQGVDIAQPPSPNASPPTISPPPSTPPSDTSPFVSLHNTIRLLQSLHQPLSTVPKPIELMHHRLVLKLVTNCCINPLTALQGSKNGELFGDRKGHETIRLVCEEAAAIFEAKALAEEHDEGPPSRMAFVRTPTADDLEKEVIRVLRLTAQNYSSMCMDVKANRKTEIDYMNGYLSSLGKTYNIVTPVNDRLAARIHDRQLDPKYNPSFS